MDIYQEYFGISRKSLNSLITRTTTYFANIIPLLLFRKLIPSKLRPSKWKLYRPLECKYAKGKRGDPIL